MPEEIANIALFLVSDMGRMIVGDIVYMTGGAGLLTFDDMKYNFWFHNDISSQYEYIFMGFWL